MQVQKREFCPAGNCSTPKDCQDGCQESVRILTGIQRVRKRIDPFGFQLANLVEKGGCRRARTHRISAREILVQTAEQRQHIISQLKEGGCGDSRSCAERGCPTTKAIISGLQTGEIVIPESDTCGCRR